MKTKEFDTLVKSKFDEGDFEYNADNWNRMQWQLDNVQKNKGRSLWLTVAIGLAASLTVFGAVSFYGRFSAPGDMNAPEMVAGSTKPGQSNSSAAPVLPGEASPVVPAGSNRRTGVLKPLTAAITVPEKIFPETQIPLTVQEEKKDVVVQETPGKGAPYSKNSVATSAPNFSKPLYHSPDENSGSKINLSVGGGFNFGASGTGYMLSATARHNLSSRFYIEGDLALVNNSATSATRLPGTGYKSEQGFGSASPGVNGGSPSMAVKQEEVISSNSLNLYYLQFSPVFGYSLDKHVRLGMGADVQRLLQDRYKYVSDERGNIQNIAGMDLGIVGKIDLSFTRRVKTTLSYREGLTNEIRNDGEYLDRDYLQIQLKYNINK